jgi:hypothetical protein
MATSPRPTIKDVLIGLRRFNEWQEGQELEELPRLTVDASLNQYFELCDLVRGWRSEPGLDLEWMEEEKSLWIELVNRHRQQMKG